ncbi:MAG TPA: glycerophosphodiester phosphodiesterase [Candidatus Paceibacterota bacterium]
MPQAKPLIIYHRGRHGKDIRVKENTLRAFSRAIKEGAAMVEFDVWSGLRITHDPNPSTPVPTLTEALDLIRGRCAVNIEIKSPEVANKAMGIIAEALSLGPWAPEQIVVSSFHHKTALRVKHVFPELRVGVVNDGVLELSYIDWIAKQGVDNLHLEWVNVYMDIEDGCRMRKALRANNMQIWVWTVNTKEIFDVVTAYGADAVFTDKPQLFR